MSPGTNGVTPNALKALDEINRLILLQFMNQWIENTCLEHKDWMCWNTWMIIATVTPLPKKGNLFDPNDWRRITLLDYIYKVASIFLNNRLQKLQQRKGVPHQFGATPNLGCQNAEFSINSFLQERRGKICTRV